MQPQVNIQALFDEPTNTVTYLVSDPDARQAAVIDPVLDYDHRSGKVSTTTVDRVLAAARDADLVVSWVLATHAHADHPSAALYIRQRTGPQIAIGEHIRDVQIIFRPVFHLEDVSGNGREFDRLLRDSETFALSGLTVEVLHTPSHRPACVSPAFSCATTTRRRGRDDYRWETTVAEERARNVHVHEGVSADEFVTMRQSRDATLPAPMLLPSVQVKIRSGHLPEAESNGARYLKIPLQVTENTIDAIPLDSAG